MTEIDIIKKTAGLQSGLRKVDEVIALFGIDPRQHKKLFVVFHSDYVGRTAYHEETYQKHVLETRRNFNRLGVSS